MRYRKLRIAWSVFWGVAAVLIIVLWVRSYWCWDAVTYFNGSSTFGFESQWGRMLPYSQSFPSQNTQWMLLSDGIAKAPPQGTHPPFRLVMYPGYFSLCLPYWVLTTGATLLAGLPWAHRLRWRFSLRSLLIATTLVAAVLGLIIWASR